MIAGDIFDKPDNPAELVNFVAETLPYGCFAVPGQHDLMYHRYKDIRKTSFWTLIQTDTITLLDAQSQPMGCGAGQLNLWGFPWKHDLCPMPDRAGAVHLHLDVAVAHAYVWTGITGYKDAPKEHHLRNRLAKLQGYDAIVTGDNHTPFTVGNMCNVGSLLKRKLDERNHRPSVAILYSDGSWGRHFLDTSQDKYLEERVAKDTIRQEIRGAKKFIEQLKKLEPSELDFRQAVINWMEQTCASDEARQVVLACLTK